jgi:hypothetical protein
MKWYFASRMRHKDKTSLLVKALEGFGEEVSFDWTKVESMKPYSENETLCKKYTKKISYAIKSSDVFVLFSDKEGTDMFIEKGIAISNNLDKGTPRIYVVGKYNDRSMMHFHPSVNRVDSIEDVFKKELPGILREKIHLPSF